MAAPLLDPLVSKIHQTTSTLGRAAGILRSAFPAERLADKSVVVQLPRRDVPTYILPNQSAQPWELLPMKAAAMAQYPNFFNNSCVFFGSIKRDVLNGLPFCLVRTTRLAIDLAKVVRNLGIVEDFEILQRRDRLKPHDFVWTPDQPEPEDMYDVALFPHRRIRLHLRTDLFSLRPTSAPAAAEPPRQLPLSAQLAPALGLLPLSVKNMSKASQPVLMYPRQMEAARQRLPAGILVCYHHELGLITDAMAEQYDVPALVAAHVGLPMSQVAQIRGALRIKAAEEAGKLLRQVTPLKSWNMVEAIRSRVAERQAALQLGPRAVAGAEVEAGTGASGAGPLAAARRDLQEAARAQQRQAREQLSAALDAAIEMEDGLLAWQLVRSGALAGSRPGAAAAGSAGSDGGAGGAAAAGGSPASPSPAAQSAGIPAAAAAADAGRHQQAAAAATAAAGQEQRQQRQQRQQGQGQGQAGREQRPQQRQRQQSRQQQR